MKILKYNFILFLMIMHAAYLDSQSDKWNMQFGSGPKDRFLLYTSDSVGFAELCYFLRLIRHCIQFATICGIFMQ